MKNIRMKPTGLKGSNSFGWAALAFRREEKKSQADLLLMIA